jgi:xylulose-5-phosphate/fructose-6-phosphate phosphoketolase
MDVINRVPGLGARAAHVRQEMVDERLRHRQFMGDVGDDMPDFRIWVGPCDGAVGAGNPGRGMRG